jgi:hypothetical protein
MPKGRREEKSFSGRLVRVEEACSSAGQARGNEYKG